MNKYKLYGKDINEKQNCQEKKLTFKQIKNIMDDNILLRPPFQTDLDENKINQMVESYKKNPDYLIFKNKVVIAVILSQNTKHFDETEYKLYLIDGQHRLEMAKRLYEEDEINDYLIFCYFKIDTDKQMKNLFREINRDSYKVNNYISLNEFEETIYDNLRHYLKINYSIYFLDKKTTNNKRYTITQFIDNIVENGYLDQFNNLEELIDDIELSNKKFNKMVDYQEYYLESPELFYKDELVCVKDGIIFPLVKNNFIDYLIDKDEIPNHELKNPRKTISPKLRLEIWKKEFGDNDEAYCPFYKCKNKINNGFNGFHAGHIISHINGGKTILENLRPICSYCNNRMAGNNWNDYEKMYKKEYRRDRNKAK